MRWMAGFTSTAEALALCWLGISMVQVGKLFLIVRLLRTESRRQLQQHLQRPHPQRPHPQRPHPQRPHPQRPHHLARHPQVPRKLPQQPQARCQKQQRQLHPVLPVHQPQRQPHQLQRQHQHLQVQRQQRLFMSRLKQHLLPPLRLWW